MLHRRGVECAELGKVFMGNSVNSKFQRPAAHKKHGLRSPSRQVTGTACHPEAMRGIKKDFSLRSK
jgi:hypothetical protein